MTQTSRLVTGSYIFGMNADPFFRHLFMGWLLTSFFALSLAASAAETPPITNYPKKISFRNVMQNQDIAIGEVEAIVQDHQGFMWLGGRNALLRYDGVEFVSIPLADPDSFTEQGPVTQVLDLFEDSRKNLWAATRSGLYKYNPERQAMVPLKNAQGITMFTAIVTALDESPTGELLIASRIGLQLFNTETLAFRILTGQPGIPKSLPSAIVNDLCMDKKRNVLWMGLEEGIVRLDLASMETTLFAPDPANSTSIINNNIKTIAVDHKGRVWAGSDNGIYRLKPETGEIASYRHNPKDPYTVADNISRQILVDHDGWVWTGSDGGGVSLYDEPNDRFLRFSNQFGERGSISSNTIRRIYEDHIGDLWVGTYPAGVNFYDRSTSSIRRYGLSSDPTRGLPGDYVEAIEEDKDGKIWIGASGMTRFDPVTETFTRYPQTDGSDSRSDSSSFLGGLADSDGEIRFGSWAHGILRYNPEKDRFDELPSDQTLVKRGERTSKLLNDKMIWNVYEDRQKNLWISTHTNGLTKFDKKTGLYTFYPYEDGKPDSISAALVWTTFEDSAGRFWAGTAYGLNLMDREKGTFKRYISAPGAQRGLINNSILSINEDRKKRLWIGTDGGLHLYHPETDDFTVYTMKDGFSDNGIRVIVEDYSGNLWLGTNNGIVMFNPDTKTVRNYLRYNGELIGGVSTSAGIVTRTGEIAFGTRTGLYIIDANKLQANENPPPVVFTDFRLFTQKVPVNGPEKILSKVINETKEIVLDHKQSMLSFSFAALNFRDPEKNQYAYQLAGFDDKFRQVGNQRSALYTNLPAGTFKFQVIASNNDGVWNKTGHNLTLKILPPPWKTWWAYSVYAAIIVLLVWLLIHRQRRKALIQLQINHELEIKVAERTAELQQAYGQLEAISLSDPLTGLSNRRYLQKVLPVDIAKVHREYGSKFSTIPLKKTPLDLTFFILDVDYFKSVNDTFGHSAGDQLLVQLSELITKNCREFDFVVRWGGEEFLIVNRFTDRHEAPAIAERIRKSIEQHTFIFADGTSLKKTCSLGFACFPFLPDSPTTLSWEQVIDIADRALYAAKRSGRNRSIGLAANSNTTPESLYQHICNDLNGLVTSEELTVIAESKDSIMWTKS